MFRIFMGMNDLHPILMNLIVTTHVVFVHGNDGNWHGEIGHMMFQLMLDFHGFSRCVHFDTF